MAAVFAQMQGNQIRAVRFRNQSGFQRAGIGNATRIAQSGNMVDINAEQHKVRLVMMNVRTADYSEFARLSLWQRKNGDNWRGIDLYQYAFERLLYNPAIE